MNVKLITRQSLTVFHSFLTNVHCGTSSQQPACCSAVITTLCCRNTKFQLYTAAIDQITIVFILYYAMVKFPTFRRHLLPSYSEWLNWFTWTLIGYWGKSESVILEVSKEFGGEEGRKERRGDRTVPSQWEILPC